MATSPRGATVTLPTWLWGNDVLGFANEAQLKLHPVDASTGRWRVESLEKHEGRPAELFTLASVARAGGEPVWSILEGVAPTGLTHTVTPTMLAAEKERLLRGPNPSLTDLVAWIQLASTAAADSDFADAVRGGYEALAVLADEDGTTVLPHLAVHFVRVDASLARRAVLPRILAQAEEDPALLTNKPTMTGQTTIFGSAWHLQADLALTRDAYLAPLVLCLTPWIWSIPAPRVPGVVIYDFGSAIVGRTGAGSELLQLLLPSGSPGSTPRPAIGPTETLATTTWWIERINLLLSEITDPANFVDRNGKYHPRRQFEVMLSIEQLGRRVQSILANDRDLGARRLGAFAALDTLHGLGVVTFDHACELSRAESALQKLGTLLPQPVAAMLLPTARRAVDDLKRSQDGFFLQSAVGPNGVQVPDKNGVRKVVSKEKAVSAYLRVLRNANHGFTGENDAGRRRDQILLMAHDGNVPDGVSLLPYLYWLETLVDPSPLLRKLAPRQ